MKKIIDGTQITGIHTIPSMYANGCVTVFVNGKEKRMTVNEIQIMANEFVFEQVKKRKYIYLINPVHWNDYEEGVGKHG